MSQRTFRMNSIKNEIETIENRNHSLMVTFERRGQLSQEVQASYKLVYENNLERIRQLGIEFMTLSQESEDHSFESFLDYGMNGEISQSNSSSSSQSIRSSTNSNSNPIDYEKFQALFTQVTQGGKTAYTLEKIKVALRKNCFVICSSDNKSDQMEQFIHRANDFFGPSVKCIVKSSKSNQEIRECNENNKKFILFILDNAPQIRELLNVNEFLRSHSKQVIVFHDEGDVIIKHKNVHDIQSGQAKSHQEWINYVKRSRNIGLKVKRVYVSATPLLVCALHKIPVDHVYSFGLNRDYTGIDDFEFINSRSNRDMESLKAECERIRRDTVSFPGGSAIVICEDRKKSDQEALQMTLIDSLPHVPSHTYNGDERIIYIPRQCNSLLENLNGFKSSKIANRQVPTGTLITIKKNLPLRTLYSIFKRHYTRVALTIGNALFGRGLSLVSNCERNHFFASVMFYRPGKTQHMTGIIQTLGRLSGNVAPGIKRRVYTSQSIIDDVKIITADQPRYLESLKRSREEGVETDTMTSHSEFSGRKRMKHYNDKVRKTYQVGDAEVLEQEREEEIENNSPDAGSDEWIVARIKKWMNPRCRLPMAKAFLKIKQGQISESSLFEHMTSIGHANYCNKIQPHCRDGKRNYSYIIKMTGQRGNLVFSLTPSAQRLLQTL